MIFVDTNYFLRFLINDIPEQADKVEKLFKRGIAGEEELITSLAVFFEIYWVLSTFYKKNKENLVTALVSVLKLKFIILKERELLLKALDIYSKNNLTFEDCFNLAYAQKFNVSALATFDKKLQKTFAKL